MEDELMAALRTGDPAGLKALEGKSKAILQDATNMGVKPDSGDPEAMKKAGFVFNGYGWVKP